MNERIKELTKKLVEQVATEYPDAMKIPGCETTYKFAELIVKECIGIADDLVNRNVDGTWTSNELYTDYNGALFEVKRRIKEYFGVEE